MHMWSKTTARIKKKRIMVFTKKKLTHYNICSLIANISDILGNLADNNDVLMK